MWWAGSSAPARLLAPVLPLLAVAGAWWWASTERVAIRAVGLIALVFTLGSTLALVAVDRGMTAYNVRDGYGRSAEWINPVVDAALALPSFFRQTTGGAVVRACLWIGLLAAAALALRPLEKKIASRGGRILAAQTIVAIAVMCAMTVGWHIEGAIPLNPEKSQIRLLGAYDEAWRPQGVTLQPLAAGSSRGVLQKIAVLTPTRRGPSVPGTLMMAPSVVPGGIYELRLTDPTASGSARLVIGRRARPIHTWDLASDFHDGAVTFELPVNVGSLIVTGDQRSPAGALTLHPVSLWQGRSRLTTDIARRVERYGPAAVFLFDLDGTFPENDGIWVAGGRRAQIAVAPLQRSGPVNMFLRNAAVANEIRFEIDGVAQMLELQPHEERTVPVTIADGRPGALIRVATRTGFRPREVEPGSTDPRFLGVWLEFR
jgi:hypothetical protein